MVSESRLAADGAEPLDLVELCRVVALRHDVPQNPVSVVAERPVTWWGVAGALAHVVDMALALVAERTNGHGPRVVRVAGEHGHATVEVGGRGEPADIDDAVAIDRFRAAVAAVGATVVPDALGPGSAGLVIGLPESRG
jgi:hypothetical protein